MSLAPDPTPLEPASPKLTGSAEADEVRRVRLRRMKLVATTLLVVAAVIYLATLKQDGVLGFVNAAAEAAMVGALADWFAVTALFRRPLGLPIPHTALIPTRKNQIGESLQEFVADNFLAEDIVREKVRQAELTRRVGSWLAEPQHARRVGAELATAGHGVLSVLRDDDVAAMLEQVVVPRAANIPVSPLAGGLLDGILDDGAHRRLVDLLLEEGTSWLEVNQNRIMMLVTEQAPGWTPQWVDNRIARRVYDELHRWLSEISSDQQHPARQALDDLLRRLARDLRNDPETQAKVEAIKLRLLEHPELRKATIALWSTVRRMLIEALADPEGELRRRMVTALVDLGARLSSDTELQNRLDTYAQEVSGYVVRNYADELATVISETVQRWDGEDASRKIELHVGRDLQFIRINGTVVGALAGLVIHTVSVLLP